MQISISGHHHRVSDATRRHIEEFADKLERFYSPIIDCLVTITEEKNAFQVLVVVNVHGQTLKASLDGDNLYLAIDGAMDKMTRQLKKLHDKRRKHRAPVSGDSAVVDSEV